MCRGEITRDVLVRVTCANTIAYFCPDDGTRSACRGEWGTVQNLATGVSDHGFDPGTAGVGRCETHDEVLPTIAFIRNLKARAQARLVKRVGDPRQRIDVSGTLLRNSRPDNIGGRLGSRQRRQRAAGHEEHDNAQARYDQGENRPESIHLSPNFAAGRTKTVAIASVLSCDELSYR